MAWGKRTKKGKGKQSALAVAKKALSLARRGLGEVKTLDIMGDPGVDTSGTIININQVSQGVTRVQRIGRSTRGASIEFKAFYRRNALASHPGDTLGVIIFCDTSNQGTAPTPGDVLETVAANQAPLSSIDQLNSERFKILYRKLTYVSAQGDNMVAFQKKIKLRSIQYYKGANSTDYQKNALFILLISSQTSATNPPKVEYYCRYNYYDN